MSRFLGLDGVRAIACLLVVFHHAVQRLGVLAPNEFLAGVQRVFWITAPAGVSVFFVLSGTLLSYPFWKQYLDNQSMPGLKDYTIRRAARIIPGFYLVLTLSLLLEIFLLPESPSRLLRYITGLTFTAGFHYTTFFPVPALNGPLWSISLEVFSYLLLPIFMGGLFWLSKRRSFTTALCYWLGVLALILVLNSLIQTLCQPDDINRGWQYGAVGGAKYWMPNYNPIGFFAHYMMGIFAAGFMVWLGKNPALRERLAKFYFFDLFAIGGLVGFITILWTQKTTPDFGFSWQNQPYYYPALALSIGAVLTVVPYSKIVGYILDNRFSRYTAKISFGIYIWHFLIMMLVMAIAAPDHKPMPIKDFPTWIEVMGIVVMLTYMLASLSWHFIEKPLLDIAHRKIHGSNNFKTNTSKNS
ncbi:peptidoglycan/LPS O-acetylase OafA/YrhL [Sporomusaceae bacterium BoRhaA]|uniref:acyltransferase family protein n=1 Tax=Pelorhabdus rhamnosifermentans TaxID=2772457 RepID=UPI001C064173|nr:acyltransferase [Pelorhabdus rhamnosifermentans]MBU2700013.1 peptidoglycan/LPS O-acetylase OafA/YrhL [Pelorhabdus rhamnosifermentans]